jgi:hypothetical protein
MAYTRTDLIDDGDCPLEYWKARYLRHFLQNYLLANCFQANADLFPILSRLARRYLSAPATSVASEQTFSVAKRVYDDNRSLLSPDKAEKLTFLNKNLPIIAYNY